MIRKLGFALVLFTVLAGCYYDKEELLYPAASDCSTINVRFATQVAPLIQTRCAIAGCHDASSGNAGGPFTNYTQIQLKAAQIKTQVESGAMPQGSSLSAAEIRLLSCWVTSGAPNN
jgi:hypothetical protein